MAKTDYRDVDAEDTEAAPEGLGNGLIVVTTLLLLGAFIVMQLALNKSFGIGLFGN